MRLVKSMGLNKRCDGSALQSFKRGNVGTRNGGRNVGNKVEMRISGCEIRL